MESSKRKTGHLAATFGNQAAPLQVLKIAAGYYIGTLDDDGLPFTRESTHYWPTQDRAEQALELGEWEQRMAP